MDYWRLCKFGSSLTTRKQLELSVEVKVWVCWAYPLICQKAMSGLWGLINLDLDSWQHYLLLTADRSWNEHFLFFLFLIPLLLFCLFFDCSCFYIIVNMGFCILLFLLFFPFFFPSCLNPFPKVCMIPFWLPDLLLISSSFLFSPLTLFKFSHHIEDLLTAYNFLVHIRLCHITTNLVHTVKGTMLCNQKNSILYC